MASSSDFGLSSFLDNVPQINLGNVLPSNPVVAPVAVPIMVNAPRAQTALQQKYAGYMQDLASKYPPTLINSMMDYDSQRVKNGQAPLSQDETVKALDSAATQQPATPEPKEAISSPIDWLDNAIGDIKDMVTSIPKLPAALLNEAMALPTIPDAISKGVNPVAGFLQAPGIRMIPGAFTLGNIAAGTPGNLLRHPVFTGLDLLPGAEALAKTTEVAKTATALRDAAMADQELLPLSKRQFNTIDRMADRPVTTALFNKMNPVTGLPIRNLAGEFVDAIKTSKIGYEVSERLGKTTRDANFGMRSITQDQNDMLAGKRPPKNDMEVMAYYAHKTRVDLGEIDPTLLHPAVMSKVVNAATRGDLSGLSETELAGLSAYQEHLTEMTNWQLANDKALRVDGEIYDVKTAADLLTNKDRVTRRQTFQQLRQAVDTGDHMTAVDHMLGQLERPGKEPGQFGPPSPIQRYRNLNEGRIGDKDLKLSFRGTDLSLRNAGYDTTMLQKMVGKGGPGLKSPEFLQAMQDIKAGNLELPRTNAMTPEQVIQYATDHKAESLGYRDIINGFARGELKGVTAALDIIKSDNPEFVAGVKNARDSDRLFAHPTYKTATADKVVEAQSTLQKFREDNLAARFLPEKQRITRDIASKQLIEAQHLIPVEDRWSVEKILAARDAGELSGVPGFDVKMYRQWQGEASRTIMKMQEDGFNPIFMHTTPVTRVDSSLRLKESIIPTDAAATKKRLNDLTPGIKDFSIAMNDMGMRFMEESITEAKIHWIADNFGYSLDEVNQMTHETARYKAGQNPLKDYEGHKAETIIKRFRALDPEELGAAWGSKYVNQLRDNKVFVPIDVYQAIQDLSKTGQLLGGIFDPATKLFRISTVALSLRTQIYNIVGGMVSLALVDPGALFKYTRDAYDMMKGRQVIPEELQGLIGSTQRMMHELDDTSKGHVIEGVRRYMVGEKMRKWWDEAQAKKVEGRPITGRYGGKIMGLVEKSYQLNGFFDDLYRTTAYLGEYNRQIENIAKQGYEVTDVVKANAAYKGLGAARKILQDYLGMTSFERNVIKSVVPFYGFIGHAIRFVLRYPFDHSIRAEIISKLAMAELEDNNEGLPSRFMSMLFFGSPDSKGNQHSLNLGPFNPFGDVANQMTLAGFIGSMNPIIQTAFQMVGLKQGEAELYPSLRYDPDTGRMEAIHPGVFQSLVTNVLPSSAGILAMIGMNSQYNDMLHRDPAAAGRYLLSSLTIPTIERQYNIPQEQFAAELARERSATSVKNQALKTGDWSEAMLYPSLQKYLLALDQVPTDQRAAFAPVTSDQAYSAAQTAFQGGKVTTDMLPGVGVKTTLDQLVAQQETMGGPVDGAPAAMPQPVSGLQVGGALGLNGV